MADDLIFTSYPLFTVSSPRVNEGFPRELIAKELRSLFEEWADRVSVRGSYTTSGLGSDHDAMFWWVSRSPDHLQDLFLALGRTTFGQAMLDRAVPFVGLVQPAEFSKDHQPAFVQGKDPKRYICVYPFVRTPEWYLLDPGERSALLREHGEAGREFPDVLANTTTAFGLGDYEWILCFEADGLDRIVQLIRRLRATEARRYTKGEIPFVTGIRKDIEELVQDLL